MGRLGDGQFHELRVHGVAGTPPAGMLDVPELVDPPPGRCGGMPAGTDLSVWRRPATGGQLRAYSWSSVTSGSPMTALYLLLLPYMLVNVAGWMALPVQRPGPRLPDPDGDPDGDLPARGWPQRLVTAGVRWAALGITLVFTLFAYLILVDLVAAQGLVRNRAWPAAVAGVAVVATGLLVAAVGWLTRLRMRDGARFADPTTDRTDPVGYAWVHAQQEDLWDRPGIIALQRRLHLGVAWAATGLMAALAVPAEAQWLPAAARPLVVATALVTLCGFVATAGVSLSDGLVRPVWADRVATRLPWLAGAGLLGAAANLGGGDPLAAGESLRAIRGAGWWVPALYLLVVLLSALAAVLGRDRRRPAASRHAAWNLPGGLLLAAATGAGMGAATATVVGRWLEGGGQCPALMLEADGTCPVVVGSTPAILAVGFTAILTAVVWVLGIGLVRELRAAPAGPARLMTAVNRLLSGASWVMAVLSVLAVVAVVGGLLLAALQGGMPHPDGLPTWLEVAAAAALLVPLVAAAAAALTVRFGVRALVLALLGLGVAAWLARRGQQVGVVLGVRIPPTSYAAFAEQVALLLPLSIMTSKMVAAIRGREARKGVGVLWDVGTFWPRWFHPFAPPTYADRVVTDLTHLLEEELADPDRCLLLAPHSQGTVIGAAAVLGMRPAPRARVALLTYGSPLRHLYREFFPAMFGDDVLREIAVRLGGPGPATRWRNLHRSSDPIAAAVEVPGVDVRLAEDPCGRGHGDYPREARYHATAAELRELLGPRAVDLGVEVTLP